MLYFFRDKQHFDNVFSDARKKKSEEPPSLPRGMSLRLARESGLMEVPTIEMHLLQQVERGPLCKRHIVRWLAKRWLWCSTQQPMHLDMFTTPCGHSDQLVTERCPLNALAHVAITQVSDARQVSFVLRSDSLYITIKTSSVNQQSRCQLGAVRNKALKP